MTPTAEIVRRMNEAEEMFRGEPHDDYSIADDMALASERLSELQAEADRLREDAERYRWLRDEISCDEACRIFPGYHMKGAAWSDAEFDAAIDAARRAPADGTAKRTDGDQQP